MQFRLPKTRGMLRREAAGWLARLQSGRDPDIEDAFRRWRDADPRNADAFERVNLSYRQAGLLRQSSAALQRSSDTLSPKSEWIPRPALAAASAMLILILGGVLLVRELPFGATSNAIMLTTNVGEIRQVSLADGSKVTLDTSTRLEIEIGRSRRGARLRQGRARFEVAPASAPFVVETADAVIAARHGVIDVEQGSGEDRVNVLAGAAQVSGSGSPATAIDLEPGRTARVEHNGVVEAVAATPASDWTRGMLQFDSTPIGEAVAIANRYSAHKILVGQGLAGLRVTGTFHAGDTIGLAKALEAVFGLSLYRRADGTIVLLEQKVGAAPK